MKRLALLACLAASPVAAQRGRPAAFEGRMAGIRRAAVPEVWDLLGALSASSDPARQLSALAQLPLRVAALAPQSQVTVVTALKAAAASPDSGDGVRVAAIEALGRTAGRFQGAEARRQALLALTQAADAEEGSLLYPYRVGALLGLSEVTDHMPTMDPRIDQAVLTASFDAMRAARTQREMELSSLILYNMIQARGARPLYDSAALADRVDGDLLRPLETALNHFYSDARYDMKAREFLMRSLLWIAQQHGTSDAGLSPRIKRILQRMSELDCDPRLKQLASAYGAEIDG